MNLLKTTAITSAVTLAGIGSVWGYSNFESVEVPSHEVFDTASETAFNLSSPLKYTEVANRDIDISLSVEPITIYDATNSYDIYTLCYTRVFEIEGVVYSDIQPISFEVQGSNLVAEFSMYSGNNQYDSVTEKERITDITISIGTSVDYVTYVPYSYESRKSNALNTSITALGGQSTFLTGSWSGVLYDSDLVPYDYHYIDVPINCITNVWFSNINYNMGTSLNSATNNGYTLLQLVNYHNSQIIYSHELINFYSYMVNSFEYDYSNSEYSLNDYAFYWLKFYSNTYANEFYGFDFEIYQNYYLPDTLETAYTSGYAEGESEGYADGHEVGYAEGINDGYTAGYEDGESDGYATGKSDGIAIGESRDYSPFAVIKNAIASAGSFLSFEIMPNISIGLLMSLPLVGAVIAWIFKVIKGN